MTLYELLGVQQTAEAEEIKRAYFRLVRQYTPEKHPEEFMRIRKAYEELSDDNKRAAYDEVLSRYAGIPEDVAAVIIEAERLNEEKLGKRRCGAS